MFEFSSATIDFLPDLIYLLLWTCNKLTG